MTKVPSHLATFEMDAVGSVPRPLRSKLSDVVSVKDFGAVGDGVTDDTAAIALAVTAAAGKTLFFPAGTYLVSAAKAVAAVFLPTKGITVRGAGKHATTIKATTDCVLMAAVDANRIDIADIGFDGSQTAGLPWQRGLLLRGVVDISIKNCLFYRLGDAAINLGKQGYGGSDAVPNGTRQCERVSIQDNKILDCFGTIAIVTKYIGSKQTVVTGNVITNSCAGGISIESEDSSPSEFADQIIVSNNIVHKCFYFATGTPVNQAFGIGVTERAKFVSVSNNTVTDIQGDFGARGIEVGTSPSQSDVEVSQVVVNGNLISKVEAASGNPSGVQLQVGDSSLVDITISSNVITDSSARGRGIEIITAFDTKTLGTIKNCSVIGNVISNMFFGVFFNKTGNYGDVPIENFTISANTIKGAGSAGMQLFIINSVISGNTIENCVNDGIYLLPGSHNNTITGNNIKKCRDGMALNGDHLLIVGNTCVNNNRNGIAVESGTFAVISNNNASDLQTVKTQIYGIRVPNGSTVRGNQLIGNTGATIFGGIVNQNTGTYDAGLNRTA
jgi:parallel beta-helix repeat protein